MTKCLTPNLEIKRRQKRIRFLALKVNTLLYYLIFDIQNVYCLLFTVWMQTSCTIIHFDKLFHFFLCPNCNKASKHSFDCHLWTNNLHSAEFTAWSSDWFCFLIELRAALIPSTGNLAIRSTFRMVSFWKDISGNTSVKRPRS